MVVTSPFLAATVFASMATLLSPFSKLKATKAKIDQDDTTYYEFSFIFHFD
ncbi:hypothetical protein ACU8V7_25810 [Zobellia nedashkovskayae]